MSDWMGFGSDGKPLQITGQEMARWAMDEEWAWKVEGMKACVEAVR